VAAALCVGCLVASACGLPYDASPRALPGALPQALTSPLVTVPPTTLPPRGHYAVVDLHFVQNTKLYSFPTPVPEPLSIAEVLLTLEDGPPFSDPALSNAVAPGSNLLALGPVVKGVVRVVADSPFYDVESTQAELEFGQVVYTLVDTKDLRVSAVQFYFQGSAAAVVNGRGQVVTGTVTEADYCSLTFAGCPVRKGTSKITP
jgi:hypothetical protein